IQTVPHYSHYPLHCNCKTRLLARIRVCERFRLVFPIAPKVFRRLRVRATISQSRGNFPSCALLCLFRRKPPVPQVFRQLPGPNCSSACAAPLPVASPCTKSPCPSPRETDPLKALSLPMF